MDSIWVQTLRRPIRSYPVHRRGRNVWRSSSAASSRESRVDFGIYRDWYKEHPKTAKKNTQCLDGARNHQEFSESWHIMMHHHESNVFSQVRFPIGGVCFATPEPQIWLRLAAFVRTRDHCRWQLEGFRRGSFSIALRMAELCQSKFMTFTIDLDF